MNSIIIVQGGQWGSEGKGGVAAEMVKREHIHYAVRTGAVNAGHTVYHIGKQYKMQQLPTGWVNPDTRLIIGAGAYINAEILQREIRMVDDVYGSGSCADRLYIDYRAGTHDTFHTLRSTVSGRHYKIGATGKGCSEAIIDKIKNRNNGYKNFCESNRDLSSKLCFTDTERMLNDAYDEDAKILIEATQGDGLDLLLGPYPFTTHKPTSCAQWLAETGLSPNLKYEICLVLRTFPIRVAGNSGPMPYEISWYDLAREINTKREAEKMAPIVKRQALNDFYDQCAVTAQKMNIQVNIHQLSSDKRNALQEEVSEFYRVVLKELPPDTVSELSKLFEMTTVTNKLRRISRFDMDAAQSAIRRSRPNFLCITFLNYWMPELWGESTIHSKAVQWLNNLGSSLATPVYYTTTGPLPEHFIDLA